MTRLPSISVVIVTCDRPRLLADALASVGAQTLAPLEVRVADEGNTPWTDAGVAAPSLLELISLPMRCGQAGAARNAAVRGARGEVLAFLDDDDLWRPDHLEGLANAFADPSVAFTWRDCVVVRERVREDGVREDLEARLLERTWDPVAAARDYYIATSAWGIRRELFQRLGGFDETFRFTEDWELLLRVAAITRPVRVPGVTVEVRLRETGHLSLAAHHDRQRCLERLAERHGFATPERKTFWDIAVEFGSPAPGARA